MNFRTTLTQDEVNRICQLSDEGLGRTSIAVRTGIGEGSVRYVLKFYKYLHKVPTVEEEITIDPEKRDNEKFLKMQVQSLKKRLDQYESTSALEQRLIEVFRESVQRIPPPKAILPQPQRKHGKPETMVLCLSDWHAGEIVRSEEVLGMNEYNLDIMEQRVDSLITGVQSIHAKMGGYKFNTLVILELGDMVSGIIHDELLQGVAVCDQVVRAAQAMAKVTASLSPLFKTVKVFGVVGNHGRFRKKPYSKLKFDNFDFLTYKMQELMLQDADNVEFTFPRSAMAILNIEGYNFVIRHGDGKSQSYAGIPYYGIGRSDSRIAATMANEGTVINYDVIGHYHNQSTLERIGGKIIMNGALKGTDEYAWNTMFSSGTPKQKLFSVHPEHGVTWEMDLNV